MTKKKLLAMILSVIMVCAMVVSFAAGAMATPLAMEICFHGKAAFLV